MSQEQWYVGKLAGNGQLRYCSMNIKQWKKVCFTGAIAPAVNMHMILYKLLPDFTFFIVFAAQ